MLSPRVLKDRSRMETGIKDIRDAQAPAPRAGPRLAEERQACSDAEVPQLVRMNEAAVEHRGRVAGQSLGFASVPFNLQADTGVLDHRSQQIDFFRKIDTWGIAIGKE